MRKGKEVEEEKKQINKMEIKEQQQQQQQQFCRRGQNKKRRQRVYRVLDCIRHHIECHFETAMILLHALLNSDFSFHSFRFYN